jgi:hypothetical protein
MYTIHRNSVCTHIILPGGGTEGSHTTVYKPTEFSHKQHRILGLLIENSSPQVQNYGGGHRRGLLDEGVRRKVPSASFGGSGGLN